MRCVFNISHFLVLKSQLKMFALTIVCSTTLFVHLTLPKMIDEIENCRQSTMKEAVLRKKVTTTKDEVM